jgi:iron complex outermembrane receptor protein
VRGTYPYLRYSQTNALFVGADVNMLWTISPAWSVNPRATLLRVTDQSNDDYLVFIPSNRYEAIVSYRHPDVKSISKLYAEATIRYADKQRRAPRTITPRDFNEAIESDTDPFRGSDDNFDFMDAPPAYYLFNIAIGFSIKSAATRYDFRLAAENLFNASYREYTNRFRYYADDLGRNFILSLKCTF